jgi:ABC-type oligopeptide transport system substrate-binding subunit
MRMHGAAKAADTAARGKFYQQAEDLLAEDVPAIPVYHYAGLLYWLVFSLSPVRKLFRNDAASS